VKVGVNVKIPVDSATDVLHPPLAVWETDEVVDGSIEFGAGVLTVLVPER
jgi:hypothetical protein